MILKKNTNQPLNVNDVDRTSTIDTVAVGEI